MPDRQFILSHLALAANGAVGVAIVWHVIVAGAVAALLLGWRPSSRAGRLLLCGPLASAATVAFVFQNPFNGTVLGAATIALLVVALRAEQAPLPEASTGTLLPGALMIVFGTFYPHFLADHSPLAYLYAAPTGLIPCPTLSIVIGFALLGRGLASRAWSLTVAALGIFYGLFGVIRLGVYLDVPLIAGAVTLLFVGLRSGVRGSPRPRAAHA